VKASCRIFSLACGEASIFFTSAFSLSRIAAGVLAGAHNPIQPTLSNPG
jgi:hypothetical protein